MGSLFTRRTMWRSLLAFAVCGSLIAGCDLDTALQDLSFDNRPSKPPATSTTSAAPTASIPVDRSADTIAVASFNIQVFGTSKLKKQWVMDVLAQVVRQFDVVAIQEIRAKSQHVIPQFVQQINSTGANYDYIVGPRLGRTNSKEQYAFIYDLNRLEVLPQSRYTVADRHDLLHREPLVTTFRVRGNASAATPFSFTLVNIHTDPDETDQELDALADVFQGVQRDRIREDDVILLGDFNAAPDHFDRLGRLPGITATIRGVPTNTRGTETYDNLLFDRRTTVEFTGRAGVVDIAKAFGLDEKRAIEVSDHFPVWASFYAREGGVGTRFADRPTESTRR